MERLIDFWRQTGSFVAGNEKLLAVIIWPHFFAIQIILFVLIAMYCTVHELVRVIGKEKAAADILRTDACAGSVNAYRKTDLTTDLKLTRYPRSLAATRRGFSFCLAVPTARLADNTDS